MSLTPPPPPFIFGGGGGGVDGVGVKLEAEVEVAAVSLLLMTHPIMNWGDFFYLRNSGRHLTRGYVRTHTHIYTGTALTPSCV